MADDHIKFEVNSLEDVERLIKQHFPQGLEAQLKEDFFQGGRMIGFNLKRYAYTDSLAAELHAARDLYLGCEGSSYGMPFKPHVQRHAVTDDSIEWFEVYTG